MIILCGKVPARPHAPLRRVAPQSAAPAAARVVDDTRNTPQSWQALLDAGAVQALTERHSSLLPAGLTGVEGQFSAGDPVELVDESGRAVARRSSPNPSSSPVARPSTGSWSCARNSSPVSTPAATA